MPTPRTPRFASALSVDPRSAVAEEQVAESVGAQLAGAKPDLALVFVSHHHGAALEELGPRLKSALGARVVAGCTGEAVIGGDREIEHEPALSIWAAVLPGTEIRPFAATAAPGPGDEPIFSALPEVRDRARASILLFADPYSFPMDAYLRRLEAELPLVPAAGGMASGGMGPGQNLLITGEGLLGEGAIGVALEGGIELRSIVSQGCRPVGQPWVVTACQDQLLQKLGGRPALDVLMETLKGLPARDQKLFQRQPFIGLAFDPAKSALEHGDFLVRGIVGIQAQEKAIAVAETLRRGMTVQLLVRDAESASEDLSRLMSARGPEAAGAAGASAGALLFSCNGRGTRMFAEPNHDARCVQVALPAGLPLAGFFAMGEIGPVGGRNFLHGFTASVAVFRPREG